MISSKKAINPLAQDQRHFLRPYRLFPNARTAFKAFLQTISFGESECVLLPAYIGWSSKEGSGVFDPITELDLSYDFYRVTEQLHIDLDHLRQCFQCHKIKVLVIIHYFGFVDPGYHAAVSIAREHGALVLEDEAHAMFTDLVGGATGRLGDACIFSLHKLLPLPTGGMLLVNPEHATMLDNMIHADVSAVWSYDLKKIADQRQTNANTITRLLEPLADYITPLRGDPQPYEIPQTYPIVVRNVSRDQIYFRMNDNGFGIVSLYHTMISAITPNEFPVSYQLACTITNLPLHQDLTNELLEIMIRELDKCIRSLAK